MAKYRVRYRVKDWWYLGAERYDVRKIINGSIIVDSEEEAKEIVERMIWNGDIAEYERVE